MNRKKSVTCRKPVSDLSATCSKPVASFLSHISRSGRQAARQQVSDKFLSLTFLGIGLSVMLTQAMRPVLLPTHNCLNVV